MEWAIAVSIATFIIPIGEYHKDISEQAIAAASLQDVPCDIITAYDEHGRGAGVARNAALSRVQTEFVVFLDADDFVESNFVSRCLEVWKPDHYIFTDWREGAASKTAPDCPWVNRTWHPITALIPTDWLRKVGGFDEALEGAEDTDLFLRLTTSGCCGLRLREPLFHYGAEGQRAKRFVSSPAYARVMDMFTKKYGGKQMACCGDNAPVPEILPDGLPGDIIVQTLWAGNRVERGSATGRLYPRTGNGKMTKVDPRDADARPDLWRKVEEQQLQVTKAPVFIERAEPAARFTMMSPVEGVEGVAKELWGADVPVTLERMMAIRPANVTPDVGALARLTGIA
jgi:hypothetical protein